MNHKLLTDSPGGQSPLTCQYDLIARKQVGHFFSQTRTGGEYPGVQVQLLIDMPGFLHYAGAGQAVACKDFAWLGAGNTLRRYAAIGVANS